MVTSPIQLRSVWLAAGVTLASAWLARGDVLVMQNGTLLLGDVRSVNGDQVVVALGNMGSTIVSAANIRTNLICPAAEKPDSYLKAARRAQQQGLFQEAIVCYEKSTVAEPATAGTAQVELAAVRREMAARAGTQLNVNGAPRSDPGSRRAEAQKLIAEGEAQLQRARTIMSVDVAQRGSSAKEVRRMGESNAKAAEEKIARARAMLADLDAPKPANAEKSVVSDWVAWGQSQDWLSQNWQWLVGGLLAVILLLRLVRRSFFG